MNWLPISEFACAQGLEGGVFPIFRGSSRTRVGNTSNIKWFEGIGEYKINWGPGYRIYLAQDGTSLIVLFGGGIKKKQQADIERAKELFKEYKTRKKKEGTRDDD